MGSLAGRTALVTGGSRGIGRGIAERLAREGALVAVHYGSNREAAELTVKAIRADGGRAFAIGAELGVPGDAEALWEAFDAALAEHSEGATGLDILVNNAGIAAPGRIHEVTEADYDRVFAVNVKAPFFVIRQGLDRLRDGGRIINISSGATRIAYPAIAAYSMTKGALDVLTLTLAQDLGPRGITVNSVSPGVVATDINPWLADPEVHAEVAAYSVFGRVGQPGDIADVVAFVASDDARWVTGQTLDASGGSALGV
ncbi:MULTISPECIES: SDR family oxidoreductase [unclassified Kitasatospora]|uniref:SDR family oxidoreductase n=1 Tax=unclassified Kitasatospora TaxID=2633591 RepID=UPI00070B4867|nr:MULTISPECIES: SDR family oxidoreductase [unclassified Kitasatospora]KQV21751.1 short-chain dehydrogenase [Kitasatospora sp. Root107]KRB75455.1 short-chain dehydrogenase [Kitasatospora sp. Root187]